MRIFRWTFAFIGLVRGRLWGAMLGYWLGLMVDMLLSQYFFRPKAKQRQHTVTHCSPTVTDDYQVLGISPNATDEEVIEAAKAAHAHHFIQTLPGGYQMELNEDASNVSQGQKQLLTIARAILADNPILILDEATSSVDTRTEVRIQKALDNLMCGRTSFIIAHRLSTIRNADLILVMKDGDIIEQGTHEQLLAQKGFYADLYNSQFEENA